MSISILQHTLSEVCHPLLHKQSNHRQLLDDQLTLFNKISKKEI
jgi:hypothetical protein